MPPLPPLILLLVCAFAGAADEPRAKPKKAVAERTAGKCVVDERLLGPRDEAVWKGACEDGKASGKGSLSITRGGAPWRRIDGEFAAGLPVGEVAIETAGGDRWNGPQRDGQAAGRGVWRLAGGDEIHGRFVGVEPLGAVEFRFARGERYRGRLRDRRPHGPGEMTLVDGSRLAAYFVEGDAEPPYRLWRPDGGRLIGRRAGLPAGAIEGMAVWRAGDDPTAPVFEGEFAGSAAQPRMRGVRLDADGAWAAGDFTDFRLDGPATIRYPDGWVYRGPVRDGRPAGRGELSGEGAREGERVRGEFSAARRLVGEGERWLADGGRYEGALATDFAPAGPGRLHLPDGGVISARFNGPSADGEGELRYANGLVYRGALRAGLPDGDGELSWPDGARYRGGFAGGLMKGNGELTLADRVVYRGAFLAGVAAGDGELWFPTGERYVGPFNNGLPEGLGEWYAAGKTVVKAAYRRGLREGIALLRLSGEAAPTNVALKGDLPVADEGPYFSLFKSKAEELDSLLRDGFYRWAHRYFRRHQAAFGASAADQARQLATLDDGVSRLPRFQAENYRLLAQLVAGNAGLDPVGFAPARPAAVLASIRGLLREAEKDAVLAAGRFPSSLRATLEQLERREQARLARAATQALAVGDFARAARLARPPGNASAAPAADRAALADWLVDQPARIEAQLPALNELWRTLGPPDGAALAERYRVRFDRALAERDVQGALARWSAAAAIGVDFVDPPRRQALVDQLAWRLRARAEAAPLAALLAVGGEAAIAAGGESLRHAWLDACIARLEAGDLAGAGALVALGRRWPAASPRVVERLQATLENRLAAGDAASLLALWPELRAAGLDPGAVFKGRLVVLRSGPDGGGRPFPLLVDHGGLPVERADDLVAGDAAAGRDDPQPPTQVVWIDVQGRQLRRELIRLTPRQGRFGGDTSYSYAEAEFELRQSVPVLVYVIDLAAGTYRRAETRVERVQRLVAALGIHPRDEARAAADRLDRLIALERTPLTAPLKALLPAPAIAEAAAVGDLADLLADAREQRRRVEGDYLRLQAELAADADSRLVAAAAATHPEVRRQELQAVAALRAELAAPERDHLDPRQLHGWLSERRRALAR